jgi:Polysaccharide biosynthesis/export protein
VTSLPNQRVETNRRPASPFEAQREFGRAVCALPGSSAAVAHPWRWTARMKAHLQVLILSILTAGCMTHPDPSGGGRLQEPARLHPGDHITIRFADALYPASIYEISDRGIVFLPYDIAVEVAGLTPKEASTKIRIAYVPHYFSRLDVQVTKVQPVE